MEDSHEASDGSAIVGTPAISERYFSWGQVSGYFDGDGNVGAEVVRYILKFKLRFSDTWRLQIETVRAFLNREGISTSAVWHEKREGRLEAFRVEVSAVSGVLKAAKAMLPFCVKKAEDLRILIDYLEGRVNGNQAIERLNLEVRAGRRSGFIREQTLPHTRADGLRVKELINASRARAAHTVFVGEIVQQGIRTDHWKHQLSFVKLSRKYGYSVSVIRRILGAR